MPIEKSWLAGREPIAGFADDEGRQRFGRRLAGRLERPALPTAIHDAVVRPFRRWLDRRGTGLRSALATAGVEFRLLTQWESESTACRLLVIGRRAQVPQTVIDALEEWRNRRATDAQPGDVTLLDCRFCTSDDLSMREYLASVLLDDRFLGPDADVA